MSEDRTVHAITLKKCLMRKGKYSDDFDKVLGKCLYSPKKIVDFIASHKMTQTEISSGESNKQTFYLLRIRQKSPFLTSGIAQNHFLTRAVEVNELSLASVKFHEGSENGKEVDGLLCLESAKSLIVSEASLQKYLTNFLVITKYTVEGSMDTIFEATSIQDLNKILVCTKYNAREEMFTGNYIYDTPCPVKFQLMDYSCGDGSIVHWPQMDYICLSVFLHA